MGTYLEHIWNISGTYLEHIWTRGRLVSKVSPIYLFKLCNLHVAFGCVLIFRLLKNSKSSYQFYAPILYLAYFESKQFVLFFFFFAFQFLGGGPRPLGPPLDTRLCSAAPNTLSCFRELNYNIHVNKNNKLLTSYCNKHHIKNFMS